MALPLMFSLLVPASDEMTFTYLFVKLGGISFVWYAIWIAELVAVIYSIISVKKVYQSRMEYLCKG